MKPDKQTWDLLIGALKGSLDAAEKFRFETWIAETENRRFYDNLTRVWREIQQRAADSSLTATNCGNSCDSASAHPKIPVQRRGDTVAEPLCCVWPRRPPRPSS